MKDGLNMLKFAKSTRVGHASLAILGLCIGLTLSPATSARDALQAFGLAARANDASFLRRMPEMGLNPQTLDDLRNNLLMIAIRDDSEALALAMLRQPAWRQKSVIEHQNQLGETPLMIAAIKGATTVVERLLALGADVNRPGWTALHYAATGGNVEVVNLLIDKQAYVDAASPNGTTPLMMAARFNHRLAADVLLRAGADPTLSNESRLKARDYARENKNSDLAFWLEMEEISFFNKQLRNISDLSSRKNLEDLVRESGGTVTFRSDAGSPDPVEPGKDVEVGGPIQ